MTKIYLFLTPLLFLTVACKKDHSAPSTNPASYQLTGYSAYVGNSLSDSVSLTYDGSTHLLTGYKDIVYGGAATDTITYQLVYTSGKCSRININGQGYTWFYTYHYNNSQQIDSVQIYTTGTPTTPSSSWAFSYNASGQISDAFSLSGKIISSHSIFAYDALGNVTTEQDTAYTNPQTVETIQFSNYDSKPSPAKAIPGYPFTISILNLAGIFNASPNNYGSIVETAGINSGNTPIVTTLDVSYAYNVAGLPTQVGGRSIYYTYRQY